jgi:hypothetical protein
MVFPWVKKVVAGCELSNQAVVNRLILFDHAEDEADDRHGCKNKEKNLRNFNCASGDAAETKNGRDQRDDQKNN